MADSRHVKLAEVIVGYSTAVSPGDVVAIQGPELAAPLIRELYRAVLAAGGHPLTRISLDGLAESLLLHGTDDQLDWVNPARAEMIERADVRIALDAESNTRSMSGVDPARQARVSRANEALLNRSLERFAQGEVRWVVTAFPTNAMAQEAEMSLPEYEDFVYGAGWLDRDDPVGEWERFEKDLKRTAGFLNTVSSIRIVAEGTDLTYGVDGRTWVPCSGRENFPDGEVFTGPIESSVEGTISFSYPAVFHGREVRDLRLRFEGGEVVEATASRGLDFLEQMLAMDDGARRLGEAAFGLNEGIELFTRNTLFDEKIGGTIHLALGTAYPETGGLNRSALHWDIVTDLRSGGEVYADGELVYRDGRFLPGVF
jgi:aminopeptidase